MIKDQTSRLDKSLQATGRRMTHQRQTVLSILETSSCHGIPNAFRVKRDGAG
jgi:Fe2+ or Zn2+ uptake regulation protein